MIYGLYESAAGLLTNEYRQGVIANNLANADTIGFKRDVPSFSERLRASQAGLRDNPTSDLHEGLSGGVWTGRTETDFHNGAVINTGNPLDVALDGPGFLMVAGQDAPLLTRDGRMTMDSDGRLLAATDGSPMLSDAGTPIVLNRLNGKVTIDETGRIFQNGAMVAKLGVTDVADPRALAKLSAGRFVVPENVERTEAGALLRPGCLENSGVEPVKELVNMIEAARAYQMNAQLISLQDQTLSRLITDVARV